MVRHAAAWLPLKGVASPVGEKAGQRERSLVGQGCSNSHCYTCSTWGLG